MTEMTERTEMTEMTERTEERAYMFYNENGVTKSKPVVLGITKQSAMDRYPDHMIIAEKDIEFPEFHKTMELDDDELYYNMDKVKEIKKEMIRYEREQAFKELDSEYISSLSQRKDMKKIEAKQKRLRELPQRVDELEDIEDIYKLTVQFE